MSDKTYTTKRLKFNGNWAQAATEKQMTYVTELIERAVKQSKVVYTCAENWQEASNPKRENLQEYALLVETAWTAAEIPADLSRWEASAIINTLKQHNATSAITEWRRKATAEKFSDGDSVMGLNALGKLAVVVVAKTAEILAKRQAVQ